MIGNVPVVGTLVLRDGQALAVVFEPAPGERIPDGMAATLTARPSPDSPDSAATAWTPVGVAPDGVTFVVQPEQCGRSVAPDGAHYRLDVVIPESETFPPLQLRWHEGTITRH